MLSHSAVLCHVTGCYSTKVRRLAIATFYRLLCRVAKLIAEDGMNQSGILAADKNTYGSRAILNWYTCYWYSYETRANVETKPYDTRTVFESDT